MKQSRLDELRKQVGMFGNVTPAAQVASELLAEVDRLRLLPGAITLPDPTEIGVIAKVMNVAPRTIEGWVRRLGLKVSPEGGIETADLLSFLRSQGWDGTDLLRIQEGLQRLER